MSKNDTISNLSLLGGEEAGRVRGSCLMFTHEIGGESGGVSVHCPHIPAAPT